MSRWLAVIGTLGLVTAGIVVLAMGWPFSPKDPSDDSGSRPDAPAMRQANAAQRTQPTSVSQPQVEVHNLAASAGPLVIPSCRFMVKDRQEVPALRDGQLLFIATDIKKDEQVSPDRIVELEMRIAATPARPGDGTPESEIITVSGKRYRRIKEGEHLESPEVVIVQAPMKFRRLIVGDKVKEGQLLALVDQRLALDDMGIKAARILASKADLEAAELTRDEAQRRYQTALTLGRAMAPEERDGARLTWKRYEAEAISKKQAITLSDHEFKQSQTIAEMHYIKAKIDGEIKAIFKNRGDAVRNLDPVFLLQDPNRLRVEGMVDLQHAQNLKKGTKVTVEASKLEKPELVLRGHLQEVTSVAVATCKDKAPLILSGSEDRTVRIWESEKGNQLFTLKFASAVRTVASATDGQEYLSAVGTADGSGWLIQNFNSGKAPTLKALAGKHKGPITCAAFSPDGKILATGGEDHLIRLWDTSNGELLHLCPPEQGHRGVVTSLHFGTNTELVSAGRGDQTILVWKLSAGTAPSRTAEFPRRSGDVADLGISPDGKHVLFDQGKDLQVLSLDAKKLGQIEGVLHNSSAATNFSTMALFSPKDGSLILTASAAENRLQLYRNPIKCSHSAEIRQLMWPTAPATCGVFAPNDQFLVTGMKDRNVLVWQMPSREEITRELSATIVSIDRSLDSSNRQVRIAADLDEKNDENKPGYLLPGDTATIVVESKKK